MNGSLMEVRHRRNLIRVVKIHSKVWSRSGRGPDPCAILLYLSVEVMDVHTGLGPGVGTNHSKVRLRSLLSGVVWKVESQRSFWTLQHVGQPR